MKHTNGSRNTFWTIASCSLVSLGLALPVAAQVLVANSFTMPVRIQAAMAMSGCNNSPGPQITMSGAVTMGGLTAKMIFRNNVIGTHTYVTEHTVATVAVPADAAIVIPKQPVLGGVGGKPWIWVQMMDDADTPLTSRIFLGRCVQGPFNVDAPAVAEVAMGTTLSTFELPTKPRPPPPEKQAAK